MRTLASIQRISKIEPIPNADKIELAHVLGWKAVVKKGEHKEGELIVYCEVDSVLPDKPEYEFLRERKFRIKTIKLRGQISQGLILPALPGYAEGADVTTALGIKQYEPGDTGDDTAPAPKTSRWFKPFMKWGWFRKLYFYFNRADQTGWPAFVSKTDETRIQSMAGVLCSPGIGSMIVTEKLDGTSCSFVMLGKRTWYGVTRPCFLVFSRNINVTRQKGCLYLRAAEQLGMKAKLLQLYQQFGDCAVQGEIIGPKIQGNKYGLAELEFRAFNIVTVLARLPYGIFWETCERLGIKYCPVLETRLQLRKHTVDSLVALATNKSTLATGPAEGIVVRSYDMTTSFKVINPEFLLKYDA